MAKVDASQPTVGEKRSLAFSFPNEKVEENNAKRPRLDDARNGGDAMDIDVKKEESHEDEYTKRFKALSDRELLLNKDLSLLKSGQHPQLTEGYKRLEKEREEKIAVAEQWKAFQLRQVEIEFEARKKNIDDDFTSTQKDLKEKMVEEMKEERRKLEDEIALVVDQSDRPRRNLRRPRMNDEHLIDYERSSAIIELEKKLSLSEREIREDITQITRLAQQMNTS